MGHGQSLVVCSTQNFSHQSMWSGMLDVLCGAGSACMSAGSVACSMCVDQKMMELAGITTPLTVMTWCLGKHAPHQTNAACQENLWACSWLSVMFQACRVICKTSHSALSPDLAPHLTFHTMSQKSALMPKYFLLKPFEEPDWKLNTRPACVHKCMRRPWQGVMLIDVCFFW